MKFAKHLELAGRHAFLSASKYSWIRYDEEKLRSTFENAMTAALGTRLHALAAELITMKILMPDDTQTLNMYVNDAIRFGMTPEQILYYSPNSFGTADAISFRKNVLRIHDLKNGKTPAKFDQLVIYVALFCLEYRIKPNSMDSIFLRIYQNDEMFELEPDLDEVYHIIEKLKEFDILLNQWQLEALQS